MSKKYTRLIMSIVAVIAGVVAIAQPEGRRMSISPNPEIQTFLRQFSSPNLQDREALFSEDERRILADAKTETDVAAVLRGKVGELQTKAGGTEALIAQLLYFKARAKSTEEAMTPAVLLTYMDKLSNEIVTALILHLESEDEGIAKEAAGWLPAFDYNKEQKTFDFQRYEQILHDANGKLPDGLIRYMYERNPETALDVMGRVMGKTPPQAELREGLKNDSKAALQSLANRPEWWVRLYAAEMLKKNPQLRDPAILRKLEKDDHPLVKEKIAEITSGR